jgi:hypothetical protein
MSYKITLLFILLLTLLFGCSDSEKNSEFKNISLTECITYKNDFKGYFESNVTPLISMSANEVSSMISNNLIIELLRYSELFSYCDMKIIAKKVTENEDSEIGESYFTISSSLSKIVNYMKAINNHQNNDKEVLDGYLKSIKKNHEEIINELKP